MRYLYIFIVLVCLSCSKDENFQPKSTPTEEKDVRIGDTSINYVNPEISPSGNFMLWIEIDTTNGVTCKVWHCGIDPDTGNLIPENGKGFSSFDSNIYARPADWGIDNQGLFYVGATHQGQLKMVRPTSPTSGIVSNVNVPINNRRRVFYPSQLPNSNQSFVLYIENDVVNGFSSSTTGNNNFQLRLLDLNNPINDYLIEEQPANYPLTAPMDIIVPRWLKGSSYFTYGYKDQNNKAQAKQVNAFTPNISPVPVTNDSYNKIDGNTTINPNNELHYFLSGIDASNTAYVYKRSSFNETFTQHEIIIPQSENLDNPAFNQSHEPFLFNNQLLSTFQLNNDGGSFMETAFNQAGEIWLTTIDAAQNKMWLLSDFDNTLNVSEPEPYIGNNKAWVYYSAAKIEAGIAPTKRQFQLRKCEVQID